MSMVFIDGRNNGYPCILELQDPPNTEFAAPFPEYFFEFDPQKNNGYPYAVHIPKIPRQTALLPPYPDFIMRCLGDEFNDGYPCIMKLENIECQIFSNVYFGKYKAEKLFMGEKAVEAAYCNGQKVYGNIYVTKT